MTYEIAQMLIASTGHVTERESEVLNTAGYSRGEYGWLIHVDDTIPTVPEIEDPSPGLTGAIETTRKLACQYLLLDRDGPVLKGVPSYKW